MYLFFDTETTGLPRNWKAPVTDLDNWPRMVQLALLLFDEGGRQVASENYIIRPEGYRIPAEVSRIHGITTERALEEGRPLTGVMRDFDAYIAEASWLVAHNMAFDEKIAGAEFLRCRMKNSLDGKRKICTMQSTTDFCAIPGPYGNKWPKLSELHFKLFHTGFDEAHNAAVDIGATARCFWELRRIGQL